MLILMRECKRLVTIIQTGYAVWAVMAIVGGLRKYSDLRQRNGICCGMDLPRYRRSSFWTLGWALPRWLRPVACRTYGFYVQRDKGLYCQEIEARVAGGDWATVVWGNHDAVDRSLNALGDSRDLTEWFAL
jgi:hypothetical protein